MQPVRDSSPHLRLLSELLLSRPQRQSDCSGCIRQWCDSASVSELQELTTLAITNHVILRAFDPLAARLEEMAHGCLGIPVVPGRGPGPGPRGGSGRGAGRAAAAGGSELSLTTA